MHIATDFDDEQAEKLTYIQQQTNQGIAEILSKAVDLYYQKIQPSQQLPLTPRKSPLEIFKELNLVGCIKDADPDLSVNYRSLVHQEIEERHERNQQ
jgi:hypothetical protein